MEFVTNLEDKSTYL